jgi:hypothetical protein
MASTGPGRWHGRRRSPPRFLQHPAHLRQHRPPASRTGASVACHRIGSVTGCLPAPSSFPRTDDSRIIPAGGCRSPVQPPGCRGRQASRARRAGVAWPVRRRRAAAKGRMPWQHPTRPMPVRWRPPRRDRPAIRCRAGERAPAGRPSPSSSIGWGRDFMRPISQELYGVPRQRVIGSSTALAWEPGEGGGRIVRRPEADVLDDGPAKPVRIWSRVGRRPILAAGNSNSASPTTGRRSSPPSLGSVPASVARPVRRCWMVAAAARATPGSGASSPRPPPGARRSGCPGPPARAGGCRRRRSCGRRRGGAG